VVEQRTIVTAAPEDSETPQAEVRSWLTPNRLLFVRNRTIRVARPGSVCSRFQNHPVRPFLHQYAEDRHVNHQVR
jgi:hypothetical protein